MNQDYYSFVRKDATALIESMKFENVLEVGCGRGNTLCYLKEKGVAKKITGFEYMDLGEAQGQDLDKFYKGNIEEFDFKEFLKYDLIMALDVLEHLKEPYKILEKLSGLLTPNGKILLSLPNINNGNVLKRLIFQDRWDYADAGILDRTHIHFFTDSSFRSAIMALDCSFTIEGHIPIADKVRGLRWCKYIPMLKKLLVVQNIYLLTRKN